MKKEKNLIIVLGICMIIFGVCGFVYTYRINKRIDSVNKRLDLVERRLKSNSTYDASLFNEITVKDIPKLSKGKTIVVWLGNPGCGYCGGYAPLLNEVAKEYDLDINYIDTSIMSLEEEDIVKKMEGKDEFKDFASSYNGVPFTMIIKNNKIVGGLNGFNEKDAIINAFKLSGLVK